MDVLASGAIHLGLALDSSLLERFRRYYQELIAWNQRLNLTAITDYQDVQRKHFLDSLTLVPLIDALYPTAAPLRLLDIGTGAGFPALPIRLVRPSYCVTLLEATRKKAEFLQHLCRVLNLDDVEVAHGRAEELAHQPLYREQFDVVVARAVAGLGTLAELGLPFCRVGGALLASKKGPSEPEVSLAARASALLGGEQPETHPVTLPELGDDRWIAIIPKIVSTPPRYPRRSGIPQKRPLS